MAGKDKAALTRALAKEKAALDRGVITRAEYNSRVAQLSRRFETTSGLADKVAAQGAAAKKSQLDAAARVKRAADRQKMNAAKLKMERSAGVSNSAAKANATAGKDVLANRAKAAAGRNAKIAARQVRGAKFAPIYEALPKVAKAARVAGRLAGPVGVVASMYDAASTLSDKEKLKNAVASRKAVMEAAAGKVSKGDNMFDTAAKAKKATLAKKAAADKARGTMLPADRGSKGKNASKTYTEGRRADNASSASPSTKAPSGDSKTPSVASKAVSSSTHTVKRGDTLWGIAQANNTTVSTLLKLNPTIAKRKADGKVTIFSGSKVRVPKGK